MDIETDKQTETKNIQIIYIVTYMQNKANSHQHQHI